MHVNCQPIEKILLKLSATVIALALCAATIAQAKFSTVVNEKEPALSDYVQVDYTVENAKSVDRFAPPIFRNFRIIQGPVQSTGMSYINGVVSQYKSISFTIQPTIRGRLSVPGAMAVIDGKMMNSPAVPINVKSGGSGKSSNPNFPGISRLFPMDEPEVDEEVMLKPGESIADKIKKNLLVQTVVNKTSCYEGEPIMATFKLCSRLRSESRVLKRPSLNGFSVFDMIEPEANRPTIQTINGKPFNVHLIRQTQLFPLQAGTFDIDPVELDNTVKFIKPSTVNRTPKDPLQQLLDDMTNERSQGEVEEHTFTLASKPVTITVKPLPANKPASFNGAVGKFTLHADWKNKPVAAGDEILIHLKIKGQGNFSVINSPVFLLPPGIEGFDPIIKENVDKTIYPLSGSKTFDYSFIAKNPGSYTIPAISFSFFDPGETRYKTLHSDSFNIRVIPSTAKKTGGKKNFPVGNFAPVSNWRDYISFTSISILVFLIFAALLIVARLKKKQNRHTVEQPATVKTATNAEHAKIVNDPLENARLALHEQRSQQFYSEVNRVIWKKLSDRINIPATELNKVNVTAQLHGGGVDNIVIFRLQDILNECEVALYTPVHTASDMRQTLDKAEILIKDLQGSVS